MMGTHRLLQKGFSQKKVAQFPGCWRQKNATNWQGHLSKKKELYLRRLHCGVEEHVDLVVLSVLGVDEEQEVGEAEQGEEDDCGAHGLHEVGALRLLLVVGVVHGHGLVVVAVGASGGGPPSSPSAAAAAVKV